MMMYKFFKKQYSNRHVPTLFKAYVEKKLRRLAEYLNRKTIRWDKKIKTAFLALVCLFFTLSITAVLLKKPPAVAGRKIIYPVMIKLNLPPDQPPGAPPVNAAGSDTSRNQQNKKPP